MPTSNKNRKSFFGLIKRKTEIDQKIFNFRRIWLLSFILTSGFAIIPVMFFALIDYNVTKRSVESEAILRSSRLTSNTWRSVSYFLDERKAALRYTVYENSLDVLSDNDRLSNILKSLRKAFGGFTDIGLVDEDGFQKAYVGPYHLEDKNYSGQDWFKEVQEKGEYISEVFLGYRNVPHLAIAIMHMAENGQIFVLRATIEHQFTHMLKEIQKTEYGDAFLINKEGILQTPSNYFGEMLNKMSIPMSPEYSTSTQVVETVDHQGLPLIVGYRYIPETPFILMVVKYKEKLMEPWQKSSMALIRYLVVSITVILLWILGVITYLVRRMKSTESRRVKYFHMAEYSNKMATIGRLAAGVAHEINNPLAIINEKAGLISDIFQYSTEYQQNQKLKETIDSIITSVERCSRITRQLLSFARHLNLSIQTIRLDEVVKEVLGFLNKEAQYRSIDISLDISKDIPEFECDRGKLQQVLLNIINNAFAALTNGGQIKINAEIEGQDYIKIIISDNGCGIPAENLKYIFEPFFSTKMKIGGTGLGLSITYGLIQELGGKIDVESEVGKGSRFKVVLPLKPKKEGLNHEYTPG